MYPLISKSLMLSLFLLSFSSAVASDASPYLGVDAQIRSMHFHKGFGENLLMRNSPQSNVYGGLKLNNYCSVEVGYESNGRSRHSSLDYSEFGFGIPVADMPEVSDAWAPPGGAMTRSYPALPPYPGSPASVPADGNGNAAVPNKVAGPVVFNSKFKKRGPHINLLGIYPIEDTQLSLFGSAGVSFLKNTVEYEIESIGGIPVRATHHHSANKNILRLTAGLSYKVYDNLSLRYTFGWLNTNRVTIYSPRHTAEVIPKATFSHGLGLTIGF